MAVFGRKAEPAKFSATRGITASAARLRISDRKETEQTRIRNSTAQAWQDKAWAYYDSIGEVKFAYNMAANIISRLRLYVGVVVDPNAPPVPAGDVLQQAQEALKARMRGRVEDGLVDDAEDARDQGPDIDPEMVEAADAEFQRSMSKSSVPNLLRNISLNVNVVGESLLVLDNDRWTARSTSEVKITPTGNGYWVRRSKSESEMSASLGRDATVGRIWREHPRFSLDCDSALIGVASDCEELLLLGQMIRTITRSRLNAGMLYVPDEISVSARTHPDDGSVESEEEGDPLETELLYSLTDPITTEQAASSVMPIIFRGPADYADKIKHITLERKSDEFLINRADRVLERILQGLDLPKDTITGLASVKYSNAFQIEESLYKQHIEPMALLICDAFTEIVLRPLLRAKGFDDEAVSRLTIWYDPSEIVTRPNRAQDADTGYDKMLLSGSSWREAHGFSDMDAPSEDEVAFRLAVEKAQVPPELATELFNKLLPTITQAARAANGGIPDDLSTLLQGVPTPAPEPIPVSSVPDTEPGEPPVESEPAPEPSAEMEPVQ